MAAAWNARAVVLRPCGQSYASEHVSISLKTITSHTCAEINIQRRTESKLSSPFLISVRNCLTNDTPHWGSAFPCLRHFTISDKIELHLSSAIISIPGVYCAIIHSARKQIPLTCFLFNYSSWKSSLMSSPKAREEEKKTNCLIH